MPGNSDIAARKARALITSRPFARLAPALIAIPLVATLSACHGPKACCDNTPSTPTQENPMENTPPTLGKLEIVKCGPYKFVGKSFYARAGQSDELCGALMGMDWIFKALDDLTEHATDEQYDAALVTWEKYDDKEQLMRYTAGRFMKPDTPVPANMDSIDIPEGPVAKYFVRGEFDAINGLRGEMSKQDAHHAASWVWSAEIYPDRGSQKPEPERVFGSYVAAPLKNPPQEKTP